MSKTPDTGRVILDENAKQAVDEMLDALKKQENCIRLNSSKLVSWIVTRFKESRFESELNAIIKAHFNSKEYLKKIVSQSETETDLTGALQAMLNRMQSNAGARRGGRKKQTQMLKSIPPYGIEELGNPTESKKRELKD